MIATIKAEWRKNRFRPAFLVSLAVVAASTVFVYGIVWYLATHPSPGNQQGASLLTLYPDQFVNNVMGVGLLLGEAMAVVLGAVLAGSEYSWGTTKTMLTQRPGRLTNWSGRVVVFAAGLAIMALVLFVVGAASSVAVASFEHHTTTWPATLYIAEGLGAVWLVFIANGAIGLALGILIRNSAAALGIGLIYVLAVEVLGVRFIDSLNNGAFKWIGNLFVGQNATALLQNFTSPASGPSPSPAIAAHQAVLVLVVYFVALIVLAAGLLRMRDVS